MKTPNTRLPYNQSPTNKHDPIKRLSLAVRELDKLINRANHLASLSEQPFPKPRTGQPPTPTKVNLTSPSSSTISTSP
jgi:hypothetical protein